MAFILTSLFIYFFVLNTRSYTYTEWTLGSFICKTVSYMQGVSVTASVSTLMAISVERCIAISWPYVSISSRFVNSYYYNKIYYFIVRIDIWFVKSKIIFFLAYLLFLWLTKLFLVDLLHLMTHVRKIQNVEEKNEHFCWISEYQYLCTVSY